MASLGDGFENIEDSDTEVSDADINAFTHV